MVLVYKSRVRVFAGEDVTEADEATDIFEGRPKRVVQEVTWRGPRDGKDMMNWQ